MRSVYGILAICCGSVLASGCGALTPAVVLESVIDWIAVGIPSEVPPQIYGVLSDPAPYDEEGHPLVGLFPGEVVIDDLANLSGCWADYWADDVLYDDPSDAEGEMVEYVGMMVLDTGRETYTEYIYFSSVPDVDISEPVLIVLTGTCTIVNERRFAIEVTAVESGVLQDDGSIAEHTGATFLGVMLLGEKWEYLATLDGDHLKTASATGTGEEPDEWSTFYTRIDCDGD